MFLVPIKSNYLCHSEISVDYQNVPLWELSFLENNINGEIEENLLKQLTDNYNSLN